MFRACTITHRGITHGGGPEWPSGWAKSVLLCPAQVFSEYFKELEEESIRDNFVIIYELLDELMDFGYPQTTDSKILQE